MGSVRIRSKTSIKEHQISVEIGESSLVKLIIRAYSIFFLFLAQKRLLHLFYIDVALCNHRRPVSELSK